MAVIESKPFFGPDDFDVNFINDPVDKSVPLLLISIATPFDSLLAVIESKPFSGPDDFDVNFINDPVDKSAPLLLISIATPSFNPSASIDITLPLVASFDSIRNIPFCGSLDFDVNFTNDPLDKALLLTWIPVPSFKLFADISINVPSV